MTTMPVRKQAAALTALVALSLGGPAMAIEEPEYSTLERDESFELRRYQPVIVAEVEVSGEFEQAGNAGFRPLANYIFGDNTAKEEIAMTAPVTQREQAGEKIAMTAPVTQHQQAGRHVVRFTMPSSYTMETLPRPNDGRVTLRQLDSETYAVIRYSGFWSESNYQRHLSRLRAHMRARGLEADGAPVWARYNAPFTPWFMRRNEILIPVRDN